MTADAALFAEMFPLSGDDTEYTKISSDFVGTGTFNGQTITTVEPQALSLITKEAFRQISHLLRPAHLKQVASILDDPEASDNDKFVALDLLKNATIAADGVFPMCQDTGTAIIMGKKGARVLSDGDDEAALSEGARDAYLRRTLR